MGESARSFDIGRVTEAIRQQIHIAEPKPVLLVKGYQDEATFDDQLGVKAALEAHLSDLSSRGAESPIAFMQDANYPDAYILAGRYVTTGPQVQITTNLLQAGKVAAQFTLTGQRTQLTELAQQVVAVAQKKIGHGATR